MGLLSGATTLSTSGVPSAWTTVVVRSVLHQFTACPGRHSQTRHRGMSAAGAVWVACPPPQPASVATTATSRAKAVVRAGCDLNMMRPQHDLRNRIAACELRQHYLIEVR